MIAYIIGEVVALGDNEVLLENSGIAYSLATSKASMSHFHVGETCKIYTYLQVREDDLSLYGFHDQAERDLFLELIRVTAVGPKMALSILSTLTPDQFLRAVLDSDIKTLTLAPGVGKKTASRIILELVDQVKQLGLPAQPQAEAGGLEGPGHGDQRRIAEEALLNLGYGRSEVRQVLDAIDLSQPLEAIIRQALQQLS